MVGDERGRGMGEDVVCPWQRGPQESPLKAAVRLQGFPKGSTHPSSAMWSAFIGKEEGGEATGAHVNHVHLTAKQERRDQLETQEDLFPPSQAAAPASQRHFRMPTVYTAFALTFQNASAAKRSL